LNSSTKFISLVLLSVALIGCSSTRLSLPGEAGTPVLDASFGDSVRAARLAMIIDPNAAKASNPIKSLDAASGKISIEAYQKSFTPAPVVVSDTATGGGAR
jgi:hypothetical protein